MPNPRALLDFWFGPPDSPAYGEPRKLWFEKEAAFDAAIAGRFGGDHRAARAGELDAWAGDAHACLALVIHLDQFSRHLYRDDPQAYAADGKALSLAKHALDRGFDKGFPPHARKFFYLPFEHSESVCEQYRSVALFSTLEMPRTLEYAYRHWEIVQRFGRFPHRNAVLGRQSTADEIAFLKEPFSAF
ncbi:MAG: DUF924 domain-containing protein [Alphaproteobacteria bacterium]|nr:DUF924 domain-containing protein [Alphaproteobacteria bacterium]